MFGKHTVKGDSEILKKQIGGSNEAKTSRNRAYLLIGLLLVVIAAQAIAIAVMMPLKTVEPVYTTLDTATGHVVKVQVLTPEALLNDEAALQSELYDYIKNCNTIDPPNRQYLSDLCRLHSTVQVARQYDAEMSADNPQNPYYMVGQDGRQTVNVTSVSLLNKDTAQVTFETTTEKAGVVKKKEFWKATLRFKVTGEPLALNNRWENPHGFAVTAYRKDQELRN